MALLQGLTILESYGGGEGGKSGGKREGEGLKPPPSCKCRSLRISVLKLQHKVVLVKYSVSVNSLIYLSFCR